jgi:acyl-CoA thioesterase I
MTKMRQLRISQIRLQAIALLASLLLLTPLASADYTILFLGDSLTEGYGLDESESFPSLVQARLAADGREDIRVINGGVSGATSASGLNRLQWYIRSNPDMMVLALGANDGLRGLSVEQMRKNLADTIEYARQNGMAVALAGMMVPPNYGEEYSTAFMQVFPDLAAHYEIPLLPFLLEDVAAIPALNLSDGIHPNAEGQRIVAGHVYEFLKPLLPES